MRDAKKDYEAVVSRVAACIGDATGSHHDARQLAEELSGEGLLDRVVLCAPLGEEANKQGMKSGMLINGDTFGAE